MMGLSFFSIVLRWLGTSKIWLEPIIRHLVLLGAFLGGTLAIPVQKHIAIDIIGILLKNSPAPNLKKVINLVVLFSAVLVSCWLMYGAYLFFLSDTYFLFWKES